MRKASIVCLMVVLAVVSGARANSVWNPAGNGIVPPDAGNWNVAANWTNGVPVAPPAVGDPKAVFNVPEAADCVVTDAQGLVDLVQGDGGPGGVLRVANGGSITTTGGWMAIGYNNTAKLIVEEGGACNFAGHLWWGMHTGADAIVEINGGTITNGQSFGLGEWFGGLGDYGQCKVYINGGSLNIHHWTGALNSDHPVFRNDSHIDIKFGRMTVVADVTGQALEYINAGKITGFGVVGSAQAVRVNGLTVITAIDPMDRFPRYDSTLPAGDIELSWDNVAEPNHPGAAMSVDVWFGTDPNRLSGKYVLVDTLDVTTGSHSSVTVSPSEAGRYYWQIDTHNGGPEVAAGDVLRFNVTSDLSPVVNAGVNMVTWVGEAVVLVPTISDDYPENLTYQWSANPSGGVEFHPDAQSAAPSVTVDNAAGAVVLTLQVSDGFNPPVSDTVVVTVYNNACEAARVGAGLAANYPMDLAVDCVINMADLAVMAGAWLEDYTLTAPIPGP